jgi:hypothetical protein
LLIRYIQLLSILPFEKVPIRELLLKTDFTFVMPHKNNLLRLLGI